MADVVGIGVADVEVLVEKTLRRVGMGVDDDGGVVMDGLGAGSTTGTSILSKGRRLANNKETAQKLEDLQS